MIAEIQFKNAQKAAALRHGIAMRKHLIHGGSEGDLEVRRTTFFLRTLPRQLSVWLCLPGVCLVSLRLRLRGAGGLSGSDRMAVAVCADVHLLAKRRERRRRR